MRKELLNYGLMSVKESLKTDSLTKKILTNSKFILETPILNVLVKLMKKTLHSKNQYYFKI